MASALQSFAASSSCLLLRRPTSVRSENLKAAFTSRLPWQRCPRGGAAAAAVAVVALASGQAAALSEAQVRADVTRRIKKLGREGKPREAVAELASMARLGIQPDTLAATALVDACARNGKMDMAKSVFEELFGGLLQPDEVVFAVMLRGYGAASERPQWNEISATLQQMERKHGIEPSAITFNALLECCTKHNDEERAAEVLQRMLLAGVQPDDYTLEAVRPRRSMRSLLKRNFNVTF